MAVVAGAPEYRFDRWRCRHIGFARRIGPLRGHHLNRNEDRRDPQPRRPSDPAPTPLRPRAHRDSSLRDDRPFGDVLMKIVVKVVAAGAQCGQRYGYRRPGRHRLLAIELETLELDRLAALVDHF